MAMGSSGRGLVLLVLLVLLALLCSLAVVDAKIEKLQVNKDPRSIIHIGSFGFLESGVHYFSVQDVTFFAESSNLTTSEISGFRSGLIFYRDDLASLGSLSEIEATWCADDIQPKGSKFYPLGSIDTIMNSRLVDFIDVIQAGFYHFYFFNCRSNPPTWASFLVRFEQYSEVDGERNYLSAGEMDLPTAYTIFVFIFFAAAAVWIRFTFKHKQHVHNIHHLMSVVVCLKVIVLIVEAVKFSMLARVGHHTGWDIVYYIFAAIKGSMLFLVIALIGTGWSYMKSYLTDRDRSIIIFVLTVQVLSNIALVLVDETAPGSPSAQNFSDILRILDLVCCCFILIPIVWSVRHLKRGGSTDGKAALNITRLQLFRRFYLIVVCYIYSTRIIVALMANMLSYQNIWLRDVMNETATLVFFVITGYLFRPVSQNPYIAVDSADNGNNSIEMT